MGKDDNGDVEAEVVRQALFVVNPDMPGAITNDRWILEVLTGIDLGIQIKAFTIVDARVPPHPSGKRAQRGETGDRHP